MHAILLAAMLATQSPANWREDIAFVQQKIAAKHPQPHRRISKAALDASFAKLTREVPSLSDDGIAVRLMSIVASIRDEHTSLLPGYAKWFPVRFYQFTDGVFITAIDPAHAQYAGAKVLRMGDVSAAEAARLASTIYSSDNDFAALDAVSLLSSPRLDAGLGITKSNASLLLEVQTKDGATSTMELAAVEGRTGFNWIWWGEDTGPVKGMVTAFTGRTGDLPLHVRFRGAYWFTYDEKQRMLYMQLNAMADKSSYTPETFPAFLDRAFLFADLHPVDRFVLDVRYNSGGNGRLINSILHPLIRRESTIARSGHLFVLTGRKTYSAGADLALTLRRHLPIIMGGEPMGVALNGAGDPDVTTLPHSGFRLAVSTNYATSDSRDDSWLVPVQLPAAFRSTDYFEGRDPALDLITSDDGASIIERLVSRGGTDAKALYERAKSRFASTAWWQPFDRIEMNETGFDLLAQGRAADALAAMEMNVDRYPDSWETWDSLAEVLMGLGRNADAIVAYEKALALSPDNWNNAAEKSAIEKMRKSP